MKTTPDFASKHFSLHELSEGIFAAVATDGGAAICNAGLVDLGGQILVYDTFLTPQAAQDLRDSAVKYFRRTPQLIVYSHFHNDHIWGGQVFADTAQIISSARTRDLITTEGMLEFKWHAANASQKLESLRVQYQKTDDAEQREQIALWMGYYGGLVEALPHLKVCLPTLTFSGQLEIHGSKLSARLITFEGGHTGSDTVLYIPQAGILFLSDLLFVGCHPYLGDGDPHLLLKALHEISRLEAQVFVPGHGGLGTRADMQLEIAYIEDCLATAQRLVEKGTINEDQIHALAIPEKYQGWQQSQFYHSNIQYLCGRLRE